MSESRLEELVNAELDRTLDAAGHTELQQLLKSTDNAVRLRAAYGQLDSLLRDLPLQQIPADLCQRILTSVRFPQISDESESHQLARRQKLAVTRFGFAAAAGVVLVAVFFNMTGPNPVDVPELNIVGSMLPQHGSAGTVVVDRTQLSGTNYTAGFVLQGTTNQWSINVNLDAADPVEITLRLGDSAMQLESVADSQDLQAISFDSSVLHMTSSGSREFTIVFSREEDLMAAETATIQLEVSSNGQIAQRATLSLSNLSER